MYLCVYVFMCIYVSMHLSMYLSMHLCIYLCIYVYLCTYIHTYTYTLTKYSDLRIVLNRQSSRSQPPKNTTSSVSFERWGWVETYDTILLGGKKHPWLKLKTVEAYDLPDIWDIHLPAMDIHKWTFRSPSYVDLHQKYPLVNIQKTMENHDL